MKQLTYIVLFAILFGCTKKESKTIKESLSARLLSISEVVEVTTEIELQFHIKGEGKPILLLENSIGPKLFQPKIKADRASFSINKKHLQKSGVYDWKLIAHNTVLVSGSFELFPKKTPHKIETYFGPRSIRAGGNDYSMLTIIPTDVYDNPLLDKTEVNIMKQMNATSLPTKVIIEDGFAWQLLYSGENAGRMLAGASVDGIASKELTSMISPSNATDFKINYKRVHEFADGNQVISFSTSPITDVYGNKVSDGTLVNFSSTNKKGMRLQTRGITLSGVATGRMLHPEAEDEWQVNAFITGEAKSELLSVSFKPAVTDFEVTFLEDNRKIIVGLVMSFMNQLIPDGLSIQLFIYTINGTLLEMKTIASKSGNAKFILEEGYFPNGDYVLKVCLAGLEKEYKRNLGTHEVE